MGKPVAFRPTEKTERIILEYMRLHHDLKQSDAINELIEGRSFSSLSSTDPAIPKPTPLSSLPTLYTRKPRDCGECKELCILDYQHCPWFSDYPLAPQQLEQLKRNRSVM